MIANDIFAASFGIVPPGDEEEIVKVAKAAVRHGFAVVVNAAGEKKPLCTLTTRDMRAADKLAQEAAHSRGDRNWTRHRHDCGIHHAITDPELMARVAKRMVNRYGTVNLGVHVGRSRMLVVDVDTAAEKAAFLAAWTEATGVNMAERTPTVLSPGKVQVGSDGEKRWVHKDGGHYWFTLPDGIDLSTLAGRGIYTADGGWVAIWGDKQVIVPPSVRAEGPYRLVGQVEQAPAWLLDRVHMMAEAHAERQRIQRAKVHYDNDPIDGWSEATPWTDLLLPDGWTDTGLLDTCGCPVFTRPGEASHHKSATAHEIGCTRYDMTRGHGPLHLWTDNPPDFLRAAGRSTLSKLQYVAYRDHDGDMAVTMAALGLDTLGGVDIDDAWWESTTPATVSPDVPEIPAPSTAVPTADEDVAPPPQEYLSLKKAIEAERLPDWLRADVAAIWRREYGRQTFKRLQNAGSRDEIRERMVAATSHLSEVTEDTDVDLWRIDGLWLQSQMVMLTAKYKTGKTTLIGNMIKSLVDGTPFLGRFAVTQVESVFIVNAEMTRRQFNRWMLEMGIVNRDRVHIFHMREAGPASGDILDPVRRDELVRLLVEHRAQVLILDPLNPLFAASGVDEDKSSEVGPWFNALADIIERSPVLETLLVHHFGHSGTRGRGSSKLMDAPDAHWMYTMDDRRKPEIDDEDEILGVVEQAMAPRYLMAIGRDVDLPKTPVAFNGQTRALTIADAPLAGSTASGKSAASAVERIKQFVAAVAADPGQSFNTYAKALGGRREYNSAARDAAVQAGLIRLEKASAGAFPLIFPGGGSGGSGPDADTTSGSTGSRTP